MTRFWVYRYPVQLPTLVKITIFKKCIGTAIVYSHIKFLKPLLQVTFILFKTMYNIKQYTLWKVTFLIHSFLGRSKSRQKLGYVNTSNLGSALTVKPACSCYIIEDIFYLFYSTLYNITKCDKDTKNVTNLNWSFKSLKTDTQNVCLTNSHFWCIFSVATTEMIF